MNTMPTVLVKDDDGASRFYDIQSKLLADRNVFLMGEIDDEILGLLSTQLLYLNSIDSSTPIYLYINSMGGDAMAGLAIVDIIKSLNAPVYTFCIGVCASAAALIFSSGEKGYRFLYEHSRVMIHTIQGTMNGPMGKMKANYQMMECLNKDVCAVLAENTIKDIQKISHDIKDDKWMCANEAIEYGLADRIISKK